MSLFFIQCVEWVILTGVSVISTHVSFLLARLMKCGAVENVNTGSSIFLSHHGLVNKLKKHLVMLIFIILCTFNK